MRCGDIKIEIKAMKIEKGRTTWKYVAKLKGKVLCQGEDLSTLSSFTPEKAAAELIGFMVEAGDDLRKEAGWKFDADVLYNHIEMEDNEKENIYIIRK